MPDEKGRFALLEGTRRVYPCLKIDSRATAFFPHCLLDVNLCGTRLRVGFSYSLHCQKKDNQIQDAGSKLDII